MRLKAFPHHRVTCNIPLVPDREICSRNIEPLRAEVGIAGLDVGRHASLDPPDEGGMSFSKRCSRNSFSAPTLPSFH